MLNRQRGLLSSNVVLLHSMFSLTSGKNTDAAGMTTCSSIKKETQTFQLDDIKKLNIDKHEHKVLVFKQSEKLELQKLGYDVSSIHEYQGKQTDHIAVVRTSKIPEEELYNSKSHCIVAITRHRKTFKYFSPVANDTLSKWVKQMSSYSDNDLAKHLRAESHIVPHTQADEHIPVSQSLTLQTHSASTLENTEKGNNTPLPITQENSTMTHHTLLPPITVGEDHQETQENGHETKLTNNTSSDQYYHTEKAPFL
ncbi:hypothetical protein J6590_052946 [Homalodisca vitripennis]|nr:hypothetical protein J6590_052946 [Homalodisca vitripennis]